MHKRNGFTAVELAVVMIIMGILLTLGFVSFRSSQIQAKDNEREADVQTIMTYLERSYPLEIVSGTTVIKPAGSYPSRAIFASTAYYDIVFGDLDKRATYVPGASSSGFVTNSNAPSQVPVAGTLTPSLSTDNYIYVPSLVDGGNACTTITQSCRTYKLFYQTESGNNVEMKGKRK